MAVFPRVWRQRLLKFILAGSLLAQPAAALTPSEAVRFTRVKSAGVMANVVTIDLSCPDICLEAVRAEDMGRYYATFGSLVKATNPLAAINGTFFDTRSAAIICNLIKSGRLITPGLGIGHSLVIDYDNRAAVLPTAGNPNSATDWSRFDFGVATGPRLLHEGRLALNPRSEGFRDPSLFRSAPRAALGITADNKLLMVTVNRPVSLASLARIMQGLGCREALNLDGGSSTGLYCQGSYPTRPRRLMTNLLVVRVRGDEGPLPHRVDDLMWLLDPPPAGEAAPAWQPGEYVGAPPSPTVELAP